MKFEIVDNTNCVVLEEGEKIYITTPNSSYGERITISNEKKGLDIKGDSEIVNSIKGEGMLEKIYIPPIVKKEEIIKKCDEWLDMYRKVLDKFMELVSKKEYIEQGIKMNLGLGFYGMGNTKGSTIDLNLKKYNTEVIKGVSISVDDRNEDIYAYLIANVMDYYLTKNYKDSKVDNNTLDFNYTLRSNVEVDYNDEFNKNKLHAYFNFYEVVKSVYYDRTILSIIENHNIGNSSKQVIDNLKNNIINQKINYEYFDQEIEESKTQYNSIFGEEKKEKNKIKEKLNKMF